jgi:hypothetical protein
MTLKEIDKKLNPGFKIPGENDELSDAGKANAINSNSSIAARLELLESLPHRSKALHWSAFAVSLMSLILLTTWVFSSRGPLPSAWIWIDIGLGVAFAIEFFTRSGFRWTRVTYLRTHFFDFVAIIPALALVHHGFALENVWVWIILIARAARVIDRFLGDGFVSRIIWALVEGFEEEITDRVLEKLIARIQADMFRAGFSHGIAATLADNTASVWQRVRAATPHTGLVPNLAHIVKLDAALERAEESTYDAVVGIVNSDEVERAVRDAVNSSFSRMLNEIGKKSWKQHLGLWNRHTK